VETPPLQGRTAINLKIGRTFCQAPVDFARRLTQAPRPPVEFGVYFPALITEAFRACSAWMEANNNSEKIPLEIRSKCVQVYALFWGEQQASAAFVALACNFFGRRQRPADSALRRNCLWKFLLRELLSAVTKEG
jgi:hypothetical protein